MSFFSFFAFSNASGPHGYQSTGLWACWSRYGLLSFASRFGLVLGLSFSFASSADVGCASATRRAKRNARRGMEGLREGTNHDTPPLAET